MIDWRFAYVAQKLTEAVENGYRTMKNEMVHLDATLAAQKVNKEAGHCKFAPR